MGYAPYPMEIGVYALGFVFFGWGVLVAIFAVFVAPRVRARIGSADAVYATLVLMAIDLAVIATWVQHPTVVMIGVVISGAFIGMNNTLVTSTVMSVAPVPRPVASAAYNFVRFLGGGIAPWVAGILAEQYTDHVPFYLAAGAVFLGSIVLATAHRLITQSDREEEQQTAQESQQQLDTEIEQLLEATEGDVVHGYVRTNTADPVSAANLTLLDEWGTQAATGVSASDGYYNIVATAAGDYVLVVNAAATQPLAQSLTTTGQPLELPLTVETDTASDDSTAPTSGGVSVINEGTGNAVAAAAVSVIDARGEVTTTVATGESGNYRFTDLAPGDYTVVVNAAGYTPTAQQLSTGEQGELSTDITLRGGTPEHSPQ